MAWLLPELDDGAEPELKPELLFELDEPESEEPELVEPEPVEAEPELVEPELLLLEFELELADEPEVPLEVDDEAAVCGPGQGQRHDARRGHAGQGDGRGRGTDPGTTSFTFGEARRMRSRYSLFMPLSCGRVFEALCRNVLGWL